MPSGLAYRVIRTTDPIDIGRYVNDTAALLIDVKRRFPEIPLGEDWERQIYDQYWAARFERASMILKLGMLNNFDPATLEVARQALQEIIISHPAPAADWYKDLGIANFHLARVGPATARADRERETREALETYLARSPNKASQTYQDIERLLRPQPRP
jgi:hypothetical protein